MEAFSDSFRTDLSQLMRWRRDVRRFRSDPVDEALLMQCLDTFRLAPSVGLSEPWRIVRVKSPELRQKSIENYQTANATALEGYDGEKAAMYSGLKLSGMSEAPEHIAIFCDDSTSKRLRPWRDDHARNAPLFCCGCDQSDVATCPLPWFRYGVGLHS